MALVKTVVMKVLADAGKAQLILDELTAKGNALGAREVKMRFRLDGGAEGSAQLAAIGAQADKLNLKNVVIRVRVDGAGRAIADLTALSGGGGGGILGKLGGLFGGGGGDGGASGTGGRLFSAAAAPGPLGIPMAAWAIPSPAIAAGIAPVVPALAAATAAVGAFAALAIPTFTAVSGALSSLKTDTAAYDAATTAAGKNTALARIRADWAALDPAQKQAVTGIRALQAAFSAMAKTMEPLTLGVFNAGLKAANALLPALLPLARAAAPAIQGLLAGLDKFASSAGFKAFIDQMAKLAGPTIATIGEGIGKITVAFGKLLLAMQGKDAQTILRTAFTGLADSINILAKVFAVAVPAVIAGAHGIAAAFADLRHNVANDVHQVSDYIDTIRVAAVRTGQGVAAAVHGIVAAFDAMKSGVAAAAGAVIRVVGALPGQIRGIFSGAIGWLVQAGKNIVQGLINGIGSMAGAVVSAAASIGKSVLNALGSPFGIHFSEPSQATVMIKAGQQIARGLMTGMNSQLPAFGAQLAGITGTAAAAAGPGAGYGGYGGTHVHYHVAVTVPPTVNPRDAGRQVAELILAYTRTGGHLYMPGTTPR